MTPFSLYPRRADDVVLTLAERQAELQRQIDALERTLRRMHQAYAYYQQLLAETTTRQGLMELAADFICVFEDDTRSLSPDQIRLTLAQWKYGALRIMPLSRSLQQLTEQVERIHQAEQTLDASVLYSRCQLCQRYEPVSLAHEAEAMLCRACQLLLVTTCSSPAPFFISGRVEVEADGQICLKTYLAGGPEINLSQVMESDHPVWLFQDWWIGGCWRAERAPTVQIAEQEAARCFVGQQEYALSALSGSLLAIAQDRLPHAPQAVKTA